MRQVFRFLSVLALLAAPAAAQLTPVTQTLIFQQPLAQANSPGAQLLLTGDVQSPGHAAAGSQPLLLPGGPTTTFAYRSEGATPSPGPGFLALNGFVNGTPGQPFALAFSVAPPFQCGGFAGAPCLTQPMLLNALATPAGQLHLELLPFFVLDGIGLGLGGVPAGLDGQGNFPLQATIAVDVAANGGVAQSLAIQALVSDPSSPSGFTFTAALNVAQWVNF